MPNIHEQYEIELRKQLKAVNNRIRKTYEKAIQQIQVTLSTVKYKGKAFNLADYPALQKKIAAVSKQMQAEIYAATVNSMKDSWNLSNKKNNVIVDKRLAGKRIKKQVRQVLYDPNKGALDSFLNRKEKGLNLSERVWNSLEPFKNELEQTIGLGLGAGKPAAEIAKDAKKYLNEPDRLFRRVRGEDGKLHLSQAARNYHPGQGVYRSSFKNAMRLARTETNMAYRESDHERWQNMPFVTGIEVKLSNSHPRYDICDELKGKYPKDFKFVGWHPQCLCYQVPELASDADFEKMEDAILAGQDPDTVPRSTVTEPPKGFTDYVRNNKERIAGWKNEPYWMRDNSNYIDRRPDLSVYKLDKKLRSGIDFDRSDINAVMKKHRLSEDLLLQLSGGVPTRSFDKFNFTMYGLSEDVVKTTIDASFGEVVRRFDFKEKTIYNGLMDLDEKGQGIGTRLFLTEVRTARQQGFKEMTVYAAGDPYDDRWDGFYRWGRLGYKMDTDDQRRFDRLMKDHDRTEANIGELVLSDEGYKFWKENGFSWHGTFDLTDGSENMNYLIEYLRRKKIDFGL